MPQIKTDVYVHEKPTKLEQRIGLLNLRSPDAEGPTGNKSTSPMVAGDVLAALRFGDPVRLECARYFDYQTCMEMMALLVFRKYQSDLPAGNQLFHHARLLLAAQVVEHEKNMKALMAELASARGTSTACARVVIEDICNPHLFADLSARQWAQRVGLKDHKWWSERWSKRYADLRRVLVELDDVAMQKIERFT